MIWKNSVICVFLVSLVFAGSTFRFFKIFDLSVFEQYLVSSIFWMWLAAISKVALPSNLLSALPMDFLMGTA